MGDQKKTVAELKAELEEAERLEAEEKAKNESESKDEKDSKDGKDDEALGDAGKKALEAEREARKKAEKDAKDAKAELDRINREKTDAERKAAEEQGNYKKLYEDLLKEHDTLKTTAEKEKRDALRTKIASEFNLPSDLAERLAGETEADLKADAEKLAKLVKAPSAPNTETGTNGTKPPPLEKPADPTKANYSFMPVGAVPIPPE